MFVLCPLWFFAIAKNQLASVAFPLSYFFALKSVVASFGFVIFVFKIFKLHSYETTACLCKNPGGSQ